MKRLFTLLALAAGTMTAMATDYTDRLTVKLNGSLIANQQSTIIVDKEDDGEYCLKLNNLILPGIPVGNIVVPNVPETSSQTAFGTKTFLNSSQDITITPGDAEGVGAGDWIGPKLPPAPVNVTSAIQNEKLYAIININMMGMTIEVEFGSGYQVGNSGFEDFHTATISQPGSPENSASSDEPNNWHSFMTASSFTADGTENPSIAYLAGYNPHTFISDSIRPGSTGKKSVLLTSSDMGFFGVANGTITTGRINAGSISAVDPLNHSWSDISKTDLDPNGDPFHTLISTVPDSMALWVKFKQLTPNKEFPYATVCAVVTDGTYYQDPEDKEYTNVLAKAQYATIESKDFAWQRIVVPFVDKDGALESGLLPKALHVTISTNASPGQGSTDSLFVDDFELIYNGGLSAIAVKGTPLSGFATDVYEYTTEFEGELTAEDFTFTTCGKGATVTTVINKGEDFNGVKADITVLSADLKKQATYTVKVEKATVSGISNAATSECSTATGTYNLNGQRIDNAKAGQLVITRYADGKTVKHIMK